MRPGSRSIRRFVLPVAIAAALALAGAGVALGGLLGGSLPTAGFTYTSVADNVVNITGNAGDGIHLKTKGQINVKTTYSKASAGTGFLGGWHYHNGPVLVTVTVGTLTFYGPDCGTWEVNAGQTYIESTGQVLNAKALVATEWFTTRLYPEGAADPVGAADPGC